MLTFKNVIVTNRPLSFINLPHSSTNPLTSRLKKTQLLYKIFMIPATSELEYAIVYLNFNEFEVSTENFVNRAFTEINIL